MSIEKARKRAQRLIEIRQLQPPVDVESLLKGYATVEEIEYPFDVDGICLHDKKTPRVFIKSSTAYYRKRFTYAHELGHILIPSHIGTIVCNTDISNGSGVPDLYSYYKTEQEANAFAAELLMPSKWIEQLTHKYHGIDELIRFVSKTACVSPMAASFSILTYLPDNCIYFVYNKLRDRLSQSISKEGSPPLLLQGEKGYDLKWIELNSQTIDFFEDESIEIRVFHFKKILSPSDIERLSRRFYSYESTSTVVSEILDCTSISLAHLFTSLINNLSAGYIIKIKLDETGSFHYLKSKNTLLEAFGGNDDDCDAWYSERATFSLFQSNGLVSITVWYFKPTKGFIDDNFDSRDSKTILREIMSKQLLDNPTRQSLYGRINGLIGNLNKSRGQFTPIEFYDLLRQKFMSRGDLVQFTQDNTFNQFLINKVKEIYCIRN